MIKGRSFIVGGCGEERRGERRYSYTVIRMGWT
jgi:hypothetical protein